MLLSLKQNKVNIPAKFIVLANQAIVSGTAFVTNIAVLKLCGLQMFGIFGAWMLVQIFVFTLQYALISQPMQTLIAQCPPEKTGVYISSLLSLQAFFLFMAFIGIALYSSLVAADPANLWGFILTLVCLSLQDSVRKILIAHSLPMQAAISDFISCSLQLLVFAWWFHQNSTVTLNAIFLAMGLTTLPGIVYGLYFLQPKTPAFADLKHFAQLHFNQGKWLLSGSLVQWSSSNLLLVFISFISDKSMLGALRLAQTVMGLFNVALQALENFALPKLSSALNRSKNDYLSTYQKLQKQLILYFSPLLILLWITLRWVHLPPQWLAFKQHMPLFEWCMVLYLLIMLVYPLRFAARLVANSRYYFNAYLISAIISALAGKWLIAAFGALGVVYGWILSQLLLFIYWRLIINVNQKIITA